MIDKKNKYSEADILTLLKSDKCDFCGYCIECPVSITTCVYNNTPIYTGVVSVDGVLKRLKDLTDAFTEIKNNLEV